MDGILAGLATGGPLGALISFFGGTVFRMLWGEVSAWLTKRQDHAQEMARMELQDRLDQAAHLRTMERAKFEADQGVKVIRVQAEAHAATVEADAWGTVVGATARTIGVWFVDAWNAVIRPAVATWGVIMITGDCVGWWVMSDNAAQLAGAALGIFLADRSLFKRGK